MHNPAAQRHRLNRAVNFARAHFEDELDLDALADVACFSKFHFTRVFNSHFGERPFEYLSRIRLERSIAHLVYFPEKPITEVAFDCGFSSLQTFSRAFRQRFDISPRSFRSANQWRFDRFPRAQQYYLKFTDPAVAAPATAAASMPVRIVSSPSIRVAYVRHIGPYFNVNGSIDAAFKLVEQWAMQHGHWRKDTPIIGVCPDHPAVTPAGHCLYDACIPIADDVPEDDIVSVQTIAAATCAILEVKCSSSQMNGIWEWITSRWLPGSGFRRSLLPSYEVYRPCHGMPGRPETGVELRMPVVPAK